MVENTFRVGKTQWSKWNDAGREAYNKMRRMGYASETGIAEANTVTAKAEGERKAKKRGLFGKIIHAVEDVAEVVEDVQGAVETVASVAAAVSPVVAVASAVVKSTTGKKGK
jgi:hypothetical protein